MALPKTEKERMFVQYANTLPPIAKEKIDWGFSNLIPDTAYFWRHRGNKAEMWCQCCGHSEDVELAWSLIDTWTCPHCGKECKVKRVRAEHTPTVEGRVMSVIEVYKGVQVVRTVEVMRENSERGRTEFYFRERYQNWILANGREVVTSQPYSRGINFFSWHNGPFSVARGKYSNYAYNDLFAINNNYLYPRVEVADYMRKNGLNAHILKAFAKMRGETFTLAVKKWIDTPYYETLYKAKERELFWYFIKSYRNLADYKPSIRIARKNGYKFYDIGMWVDYVGELMQLGMDTRSPKCICPDDLIEAHGKTRARLAKIREAERKAEERRKIREREADYAKHIAPYIALSFQSKNIEVVVLPTVKAVYDEGEAMHHCIYTMGYYQRQNTLLMSARDRHTGKRLESIEINLDEFKVMQSRGVCNKPTEQHNKIVRLLNANMNKIKSIREAI